MGSPRTVVFVCQHGAAKSVLAAALLERLAAEQGVALRALARGTEPEPRVAPTVVAGLLGEGVDVEAWQPRLVTPDDLAPAWRIISFGPDLSHLLPEGALVEAWDNIPAVADSLPAAQAAIAARLPELIQSQPD
jgi:arsenate reductase (thioredoxin)